MNLAVYMYKHNMKALILIILCLNWTALAQAQSPLEKKEKQLNFGFGLGDNGIPVYLGADLCIASNITLGLQANYRAKNNLGSFGVLGNGNYHLDQAFNLPPEWNAYTGLNVGIFFQDTNGNHGNHGNHFGFGVQLGGRYFFNDRWGLNLELGGGNFVNEGKLGLTVKL